MDDEGYQVVTRARGELKARAAVPATAVQAPVFRFAHNAEASKKRRAEEQLVNATEGASVQEQIQSLKSLIVQLIDQNEDRQEEIEKQRQEIGGLRREMEVMRKLLQEGNTAQATYATVTATGVQHAWNSGAARSTGPEGSRLSQRVQHMGAQAIIGAFRTFSSGVLNDEAGLEAVETRLARKTAKHALDIASSAYSCPPVSARCFPPTKKGSSLA